MKVSQQHDIGKISNAFSAIQGTQISNSFPGELAPERATRKIQARITR